MGKTAAVLREVCGISIMRGGVAQALARLGERCGPSYLALVRSARNSLIVVMDETGWRVCGIKAWLWVAATALVTVYAIRQGRGFEEAAELIGKDYTGRLVRDGWGPYRGFKKARHQTCAAHLLRRCDEMLETAKGRGREIPRAVKAILCDSLIDHYLHARPHQGIDQRRPREPTDVIPLPVGPIERRDRLGGDLHEYGRAA